MSDRLTGDPLVVRFGWSSCTDVRVLDIVSVLGVVVGLCRLAPRNRIGDMSREIECLGRS